MSNPRVKAERSRLKDKKQTPAPDIKPKKAPSKKHKPFKVEYKWVNPIFPEWNRRWHTQSYYRTKEIAEKFISDDKRKHPDTYIYRIKIIK